MALRQNGTLEYADGRGIRIAILDTGCDLAARGMETTTTGERKYLDFLDCTGDGDVDTRTKRKVDVKEQQDGTINVTVTGISGKTLSLPTLILGTDKEPLEVRLGAVALFHILPRSALKRVQAQRKEKFMQVHNARIAQGQKSLDQLRQQQQRKPSKDSSSSEKDTADSKTQSDDGVNSTITKDQDNNETASAASLLKKEIKEAETLIEELQDMAKTYTDAGPIMDIVLFQKNQSGGSVWHAMIDLEADGNLTSSTPMAPYAIAQQFGTFLFGSQVTFCIQIYEDGDVLSICCDGGSHGTHVAGIAAANHPSDDPVEKQQKDGAAPGAQVLACKIGDNRVSTTETGTGLIRALIAAKKHNCHVINLSYGEPAWQSSGRVKQVFDDAVHKWGMTIFTSAGNAGPALSTIGSPGDMSSVITVGAYISPQMMSDQYSTLIESSGEDENTSDELPGASYSFSSRGPTPDGLLPDLCAPGGAIAPIPRHTLQGRGQKHGTSMASPSACGATAVLLSALKAKGVDIDNDFGPHELRRALQNSAMKLPSNSDIVLDPFAQGAGLISVHRALDYALAHHGKPGQNLAYDIKIDGARGIYIRDASQLAGPMTRTVSVMPRFENSLQKTEQEIDSMLSLELDLDLIPSQKWVTCPRRMTLVSAKEGGLTFAIRLDPRSLAPGAHFCTVDAIDSNDAARGPLFQVPITIVIPHAIVGTPPFKFAAEGDVDHSTQILDSEVDKTMQIQARDNGIDVSMKYELSPGAPSRRFLSVPASAEWADIKIRSVTPTAKRNAPHSLLLHAMPFVRGDLHHQLKELKSFFQLNEGTERTFHVQVKGGSTLEICMQLSWLANPSPVSVVADVEFHSLDSRPPNFVSSQPLRISAATEFARFGAGAPFRPERINPKATLSGVYRTIRPKEFKISAASYDDRDILPPSDAEIKASSINNNASIGERQKADGTLVYKSILDYSFKLSDSKEDATISVTPRIPSLFLQLYDSPVDSQIWRLEDKNGKILGYGSCMHEAPAVSLASKPGGEYKLSLRISHPKRAVLEQLKDLPLRLSMKLTKDIDCPIYSQMDKASTPGVTDDGREQVKLTQLRRGAHVDLYVSRPTTKLPDWIGVGDVMFGKAQLNQKNEGATSLDLFYEVPPKSDVSDGDKKKDEKKKNDDDDNKKLEDDFVESIFKAKVSHLAKLRGKKKQEAFESLAGELKKEKNDSLPLLDELLSYAKEAKVPDGESNEKKWRAIEVSKAVDAMLSTNGGPIDEGAIAQYYGCNNPPSEDDDEEEKKEEVDKTKKEMDERRKAWRSALLAKAGAWSDATTWRRGDDQPKEEDMKAFDDAVKGLKKWVGGAGDLSTDKEKARYAMVLSRNLRCHSKHVGGLAVVRKACKDLPQEFYRELTDEIVAILEGMDEMDHILTQIHEDLSERYPKQKQIL
jgi:tripeptidyl-peptidase II